MVVDAKKVVILGSLGCGKTALVDRAVSSTFSADYKATFGSDLTIKTTTETKLSTLNIWSCSGHEKYRPLMEQFILSADVVILCFDLLKTSSFTELPFWYNEMRRLAANADDADDVSIQNGDALKLAKEWGCEYRAVSSKTGSNVNELFSYIIQNI